MKNYKIKTASAVYTGGGIYIYYGELESGLYFRTCDEWESVCICNSDTEAEEADYSEFFEAHTVEELTGDDFAAFWNLMLSHIIDRKATHGKWSNYDPDELAHRYIKPATPPTIEQLKERIEGALETELGKIYNELSVESGDISPLDSLEWDRLTAEMAKLFEKLIVWNTNEK